MEDSADVNSKGNSCNASVMVEVADESYSVTEESVTIV